MIIGVSPDPVETQKAFSRKLGLPFRVLADVEHSTAEAFGVWREKSMYGRKYMGVERATFVIDSQGRLFRAFPNVQIEGHATEVLEAVRSAGSAPRGV